MGIYTKTYRNSNGISYTHEVDSSLDYSGLTNETYFKNLDDGLIYYKNQYGSVAGIFLDSIDYQILFVEVEQVLQTFRDNTIITDIQLTNIDTLSYDVNETGSFTTLTLPGDLPLNVTSGDTVTWQVAYSAGKDKADMVLSTSKTS